MHQTVEGNTLSATGTTDPLPTAYAIYLTARRIGAHSENVSDPADIDAEWNSSASVRLPTGDYEVSAVPAPLAGPSGDEPHPGLELAVVSTKPL